jgi:hypothetical protein
LAFNAKSHDVRIKVDNPLQPDRPYSFSLSMAFPRLKVLPAGQAFWR